MAVRAVIYDDRRGGYIDNVPATFTRQNTDIGIHYANYPAGCADGGAGGAPVCQVPPGSPVINNLNVVGSAINPVTYQGIRAELLYKFNDDWNFLLTQSYQDMNSQGVFYQQPNASDGAALNPLEVTLFNPSYDKDKFESTAWTLNGKFGDLKAVYTGGYLVRNVDQVGDYTNYSRGVYADYYQCFGPTSYHTELKSTCYSPSSYWHSVEKNEHQQHEFRVSTPDDWRARAIAGAFWENNTLYDQTGWNYKTVPSCTNSFAASNTPGNTGCFANIGTVPGTSVQNPGVQSSNTSFYQDTQRTTKQTAFFVSADYDLIPKVLTATVGTRHFRFDNSSAGSVTGSFYCFEAQLTDATGCHVTSTPTNPVFFSAYNLNNPRLADTESGFKSRGNLTWHVTPDIMVYYTFSQGFRPGGFNQNGNAPHAFTSAAAGTVAQYLIPSSYQSDKLTNNEIGWKTEFFDHRLQWNGAVYRENWDNVQVAFFDPGVVGNIFFNDNGQNFLVKGVETSLVGRVTSELTLQGAASWNQSRQTNSPILLNNNPASPDFGKPITTACSSIGTGCAAVTNPFGTAGSPSANAPPLQFSLRARYEWSFAGYTPFVQVAASHNGHSFTQAGSNPSLAQAGGVSTGRLRFENPAYTTVDASLGIAKDAWFLNVHGENLANSNASVFVSTDQFIVAQTPLRPRIVGLAAGYKF
jgi:outer membrane receptor protein involved in Fe transport